MYIVIISVIRVNKKMNLLRSLTVQFNSYKGEKVIF